MIKDKVVKYIQQHKMLQTNDTLLVGLSGGADSVALLLLLKDLGYSCIAAHCNFQLRGEESNRDEAFVTSLCKRLHIPLYKTFFDTNTYAQTHKISIEMACRELRYTWFDQLIKKGIANKLAIAHHRDDNIETLLLNLIRGTGIKGLTGIQPINQYLIRPLLNISRAEIEAYLKSKKESFVTDSTNLQDDFARNKIRLNILPQMEQINEACQTNINRTLTYLNEAHLIYQKAIKESIKRVYANGTIQAKLLAKETSPQTVLFEICHPLGFNSAQVEAIFTALYETTESRLFTSKTHTIRKTRDYLHVESNSNSTKTTPPTLIFEKVEVNANFKIPKDPTIACFDADLINKDLLNLRTWIHGDSFVPFGMTGSKKLSDFYTDEKYSMHEKDNQWLLTHNKDIIWIIGKRTDNRYRLTTLSKNALLVKSGD